MKVLKKISFSICLCAGLQAQQDLNLPTKTLTSGNWGYQASGSIYANAGFVSNAGVTLTLDAQNSINLGPGFHAAAGSSLQARIASLSTPLSTAIGCAKTTGQTCPLPSGIFVVSNTTGAIDIEVNGTTLQGGTANRTDTMLVRDPSYTGALISVGNTSGFPLNRVTVQNLTVCGGLNHAFDIATLNTVSFPASPVGCPRTTTTCGEMMFRITRSTAPNQPAANPGDFECVDVEVDNADMGLASSVNPFTYSGPYGVWFSNVDLEDSTGYALSLYANGYSGKKVNDIYISGSAMNNAALSGIVAGVNGLTSSGGQLPASLHSPTVAEDKYCDGHAGYADDISLYYPRDIRVEGTTFSGILTGAIGANTVRYFALRGNTFYNNYISPQGGNPAGGTVEFDGCSDQLQITNNNTFTGPQPQPISPFPVVFQDTQALELYGRNFTVSGNTISNYGDEGILAASLFQGTFTGNTVQNSGTNGANQGAIEVTTSFPPPGCTGNPRDSQTVAVSNNTAVGGLYGIQLVDQLEPSRLTLDALTISANSLSPGQVGLDPAITLSGYSGPQTTSTGNYEPTPRALGLNPVGPVPYRCPGALDANNNVVSVSSTAGSSQQEFTFSAFDAGGSGNVHMIEGIFSVSGDNITGNNGPDSGTSGCHFLYFPPTNTIYLDASNGANNNFISTIIGPSGTDIATSYCTIHAASSLVTSEPLILNLYLNMQFSALFPNPTHIYTAVENNQGTYAAPGWSYWGWWLTH